MVKVMVVEDSAAMRGLIASILGQIEGAEIIEVADGFEALKRLPNNQGMKGSLMTLLLARDETERAEAIAQRLDLPINAVRASPMEFFERTRAGIERDIPFILINTVPKSASESIWNKLAEGLGIAQGHVSLGLYPDCCLLPLRMMAAAQGKAGLRLRSQSAIRNKRCGGVGLDRGGNGFYARRWPRGQAQCRKYHRRLCGFPSGIARAHPRYPNDPLHECALPWRSRILRCRWRWRRHAG